MVMGGGVNAMTKVATAMSAAAHQPPRIVPSTSFFQVSRLLKKSGRGAETSEFNAIRVLSSERHH
jgi:hypothetical protein